MEKQTYLYECPYDKAISCTMDEACLYCEEFRGNQKLKVKGEKE